MVIALQVGDLTTLPSHYVDAPILPLPTIISPIMSKDQVDGCFFLD